eukprot:TRINITY_DN3226_c0_g1_i1.p1 TRINITY_DN3226_c0_g1~~TRINITY_DN3226_c0_g1_i1.p1  ORF type:complete len:822 (-),score=189.34 TRINITY_DN3226_c0_g1_i1:172-2637(-)
MELGQELDYSNFVDRCLDFGDSDYLKTFSVKMECEPLNDGDPQFNRGNYVIPTGNALVERVVVNENSVVRDDKTNTVQIGISDLALLENYRFIFQNTILADDSALTQQTSKLHPSICANTVFIFFVIKPTFGTFKNDLDARDLVQVQDIERNATGICIRVLFSRNLRPTHSLTKEFQKKKKNFMNLHVHLFYKANPSDSTFVTSSGVDIFRFRSNSGKTRVYTKKRKIEAAPIEPTVGSVFVPAVSTPSFNYNVKSFPVVHRIHPNRCYAFQNYDHDNVDVTILLIGENLEKLDFPFRVFFINPYSPTFMCEAYQKTYVEYNEKEFYVPCLTRLLSNQEIIALPEQGLTVDVIFIGTNGQRYNTPQKYTYLNLRPVGQLLFYGNTVGAQGPSYTPNNVNYANTSLSPSSLPPQPSPSPAPLPSTYLAPSGVKDQFNLPKQYIFERDLLTYFERRGFDVNKRDQHNRNILHYLALVGYLKICKLVLEQDNTIVNTTDIYDVTPLHLAVFYGRKRMVKLLLDHGADPLLIDCNGDSPLSLAIHWNELDIIDLILSKRQNLITDMIVPYETSNHRSLLEKWLSSMKGLSVKWRLGSIPYMPQFLKIFFGICSHATLNGKFDEVVSFDEKTKYFHIKLDDVEAFSSKFESIKSLYIQPSYPAQEPHKPDQVDKNVDVDVDVDQPVNQNYVDHQQDQPPVQNNELNNKDNDADHIISDKKVSTTLIKDIIDEVSTNKVSFVPATIPTTTGKIQDIVDDDDDIRLPTPGEVYECEDSSTEIDGSSSDDGYSDKVQFETKKKNFFKKTNVNTIDVKSRSRSLTTKLVD